MLPVGTVIKHHLLTILLMVALACGLAGLYATSVQSTYTSSALILLSPAPGNPLSPANASGSGSQLAVAMDTEAQLVPSAAVRDAVAEDLGRTLSDSDERLNVTVPPNTQMLEIKFTAPSPARARDAAQGFAEAYLEYRSKRAGTGQEARIEELNRQIQAAEGELRRATAQASGEDPSSYAAQEVPLLASRLAQLGETLSEAESVSTSPGTVINPASTPESPNELPSWVFMVGAALVGALIGIGVAFVREWRRDLVRHTETEEVGMAVFSTVSASPLLNLHPSIHGSAEHEAYRRLRAVLIANAPRPHVLAVASIDRETSTPVTANLALVLAEANFSVLLVAPEVGDTSLEELLGVTTRHGLSNVLTDLRDPRELIQSAHGVGVIADGLRFAGTSDLVASPAFRGMVDGLRPHFDYILMDAGTMGSADCDSVLLAADSVLVAMTKGSTTRTQLEAARERFEQLGIRLLGTVGVDVGARRAPTSRADRRSHMSQRRASAREDRPEVRVDDGAHAR